MPKLPDVESIKRRFDPIKARFEPFYRRHEAIFTFLMELQHAWGADRPTRLSAALAYYSLFTLAPVIFIAFTVADIFINRLVARQQFYDQLSTTLGPDTAQFIQDIVLNVAQRTTTGTVLTSLIGFAALLYAASGMFTSLRDALNSIWKAPPHPRGGIIATIETRLLAFGFVIGLGLVLTFATVINVTISILDSLFKGITILGTQYSLPDPGPVLNYGSMFVLVTLSFAALYKILPNVHITWKDVWLGAALAALLVGVASFALGIYLKRSNVGSAFDAAGAMAVLLVSLNYMAQIFLFGAIFSKVYAHQFGSKRGTKDKGEGEDEQSTNSDQGDAAGDRADAG
jgi:membrane protein